VDANAPFLGGHESPSEFGGSHLEHRHVDPLPGIPDGAEQMLADAATRREVDLGRKGDGRRGE